MSQNTRDLEQVKMLMAAGVLKRPTKTVEEVCPNGIPTTVEGQVKAMIDAGCLTLPKRIDTVICDGWVGDYWDGTLRDQGAVDIATTGKFMIGPAALKFEKLTGTVSALHDVDMEWFRQVRILPLRFADVMLAKGQVH